nr:MAG TPA: portal protein [Caudoviricetes sp.]
MKRKPWEPEQIFEEYETGRTFKSGLGRKGLYEQGKINERFYIGDQWHGARCGNDRPLVRHNVIKRIGDYKMAVVASNPVTVNYSVEGVPNTVGISDRARDERDAFAQGQISPQETMGLPPEEELAVTMTALSDYFKTTAERVKFDDLKEQALRNAYVSGTGVLYTYWDDKIRTGLYADESGTTPIQGDIACEVLDIENVYFGDPNLYDVQAQPYIIIAQRKSVADLQREARRNGRSEAEIDAIKPDRDTGYMAGDMSEDEPEDSRKATVLTKFWKEWAKDGTCKIMASVAVRGATIRYRWDTKLRLYPLAVFRWERRRNCAYGESEITYLIPNQIAINRMLTASVWAVMMLGMPLTLVNGDVVNQPITNDPGQIIKINGTSEDMLNAVRYVNPPNFAPAFDNNIASLISNTLTQSGANDAALGDVRPDNTSAIVAVREAATMPMQTVQNRFYSFVEDVARVWAEMWVTMYGRRSLKIEDENGVWYMPFDGEKYRDLLISVKVDVGASALWSEIQSVNTLDNLLASQIITPKQYLERLPKGSVPNLSGLIREMQEAQRAQEEAAMQAPEQQGVDAQSIIDGLPPEYRQAFDSVPPEQQAAMLQEIGVM